MKYRMTRLAGAIAFISIVASIALAQESQITRGIGRDADERSRVSRSGRETRIAQNKETSSIYLVVEEGFTLPSLPLDRLAFGGVPAERLILNKLIELSASAPRNVQAETEVVFRLDGGSARFEQNGGRILHAATSTVIGGMLRLPAIKAGKADEESLLKVLVDGEEVFERLPVTTVPAEAFRELEQYRADNEAAFLSVADHSAIVDTSKLTVTPGKLVSEVISLNGSPIPAEEKRQIHINSFTDPWKAGLVIWNITDPKGAGYSYLPELPPAELKWASAPRNEVDAIYNKNWGCDVALKIPNHCTARIFKDWMIGFCNPIISLKKGRIRWVTPAQGEEKDWPRCPLQ
ncbi:MAG: hypothetical protein L0312_00820 [Acidobacteria bacterium]|nr:hypothetical protein [Acidobacteriota bacterium]